MENYDHAPAIADTDDEANCDSPVMNKFFEDNGYKAIMGVNNFNLKCFMDFMLGFMDFMLGFQTTFSSITILAEVISRPLSQKICFS